MFLFLRAAAIDRLTAAVTDAKETPRQAVIQALFPQPTTGWTSGSSSRQGLLWLSAPERFIPAKGEVMEMYWEMLPKGQCLLTWEILKSSRSLLYTLKAHFERPYCSHIFIIYYIVQIFSIVCIPGAQTLCSYQSHQGWLAWSLVRALKRREWDLYTIHIIFKIFTFCLRATY